MTADKLRLVIVYYPISMLLLALLAGYSLRDVVVLARNLIRRFLYWRRVRAKRYLTHFYGGCIGCSSGWQSLSPGDPCPSCGVPLVDQREAYALFLSREAS